jgi:hypothetical protein
MSDPGTFTAFTVTGPMYLTTKLELIHFLHPDTKSRDRQIVKVNLKEGKYILEKYMNIVLFVHESINDWSAIKKKHVIQCLCENQSMGLPIEYGISNFRNDEIHFSMYAGELQSLYWKQKNKLDLDVSEEELLRNDNIILLSENGYEKLKLIEKDKIFKSLSFFPDQSEYHITLHKRFSEGGYMAVKNFKANACNGLMLCPWLSTGLYCGKLKKIQFVKDLRNEIETFEKEECVTDEQVFEVYKLLNQDWEITMRKSINQHLRGLSVTDALKLVKWDD